MDLLLNSAPSSDVFFLGLSDGVVDAGLPAYVVAGDAYAPPPPPPPDGAGCGEVSSSSLSSLASCSSRDCDCAGGCGRSERSSVSSMHSGGETEMAKRWCAHTERARLERERVGCC